MSITNKASDLLTGGRAILAKASNADKGKLPKKQWQKPKRSKKGQNLLLIHHI